jgi:Protein of unknown function (DUF3617)
MRKRFWTTLGYWLLMGMVAGWAQESRKAGLWLVATSTRIAQQGKGPGNLARDNGQPLSADDGVPECLTQEMIENYGVILPPSLKSCELYNVVQTGNSFKADMTCKGGFNGFGSVESTWKDPDHVVGKIRFVSKSKETEDARAMAWTEDASAVFKSADCGKVKPKQLPAKPAAQ